MFSTFANIFRPRPGLSRNIGTVTLMAALLLGGCAPTWKPLELNLAYQPIGEIRTTEAPPVPGSGRIAFTSLTDDRSNKDTIGTTNVPVLGNDILPWLEAGFRSLDSYGYQVDDSAPADTAAYPGIVLQVSLTKLYCSSQISTMRTAVICVVTFTRANEMLGRRTYRGEYIKEKSLFGNADYAFSADTIMYGLNYGLASVVDQVENDLRLFRERG